VNGGHQPIPKNDPYPVESFSRVGILFSGGFAISLAKLHGVTQNLEHVIIARKDSNRPAPVPISISVCKKTHYLCDL
jgi:hypothetical protein